MNDPDPIAALQQAAAELRRLGKAFAVVGGIAVSVRGEVRFTRDVDLAVHVADDVETESMARDLRARGYEVIALVEHDDAKRLGTVRLRSPSRVTVDLLTASSGIEPEIVARATLVPIEGIGALPVAAAEELVAMKVLSMDDRRLQDRIDVRKLFEMNPDLDLDRVRDDLALIARRGFARKQDLSAKLEEILEGR